MAESQSSKEGPWGFGTNSPAKVESKIGLTGRVPQRSAGLLVVALPLVLVLGILGGLFLACDEVDVGGRIFFAVCFLIALVALVSLLLRKPFRATEAGDPDDVSELNMSTSRGVVSTRGISPIVLTRNPALVELMRGALLGAEELPPPDGVVEDAVSGRIRKLSPQEASQRLEEMKSEGIQQVLKKCEELGLLDKSGKHLIGDASQAQSPQSTGGNQVTG